MENERIQLSHPEFDQELFDGLRRFFDGLGTETRRTTRRFRGLDHALREITGRKQFYPKRRWRSMKGK